MCPIYPQLFNSLYFIPPCLPLLKHSSVFISSTAGSLTTSPCNLQSLPRSVNLALSSWMNPVLSPSYDCFFIMILLQLQYLQDVCKCIWSAPDQFHDLKGKTLSFSISHGQIINLFCSFWFIYTSAPCSI